MKTEPLVVERTYNAPVSKVWQALTDNEKMKKWYFDIPEFKLEVGFEFHFYAGEEGKKYLHLCKITEVVPREKLSYTWRYDGYPGDSLVTFELSAEGDKTRLKLVHEKLESFGTENPDLAKENFAEGWNSIIGTLLREYVENNN